MDANKDFPFGCEGSLWPASSAGSLAKNVIRFLSVVKKRCAKILSKLHPLEASFFLESCKKYLKVTFETKKSKVLLSLIC